MTTVTQTDRPLVRFAEAARLAGVNEAKLIPLITSKKLTQHHVGHYTYIDLDELAGFYPGVKEAWSQQATDESEEASATGGSPNGEEASREIEVGSSLSSNAEPNEAVIRARMGDTKYSGLQKDRSITPNRRGRDASSRSGSVEVYRTKTPRSVRRREEEHKAELQRVREEYRQTIDADREIYERKLAQLREQIDGQAQQIERMRLENQELKRARRETDETRTESSEKVDRLQNFLDEATARAERLSTECQLLMEVIQQKNDENDRLRLERNTAQRERTAERERSLQVRNRLISVIQQMSRERRSRIMARRQAFFERLRETIMPPGLQMGRNDQETPGDRLDDDGSQAS